MRIAIVLPTFNERDNIEAVLRAIRCVSPAADIVVVDDGSPDGTADAARGLDRELGAITVIDRSGPAGLGSAYRAGFARVLGEGYDIIVSMDADLSHDPADIPTMLRLLGDGADIVIGSRYVPGGSTAADWPIHRRLLSRWGNVYTGFVLDVPTRDATSGYRAYHAAALAAIEPATTRAEGYAFLTELTRRAITHGLTVAETPIVFRDRTRGRSKMSGRIILESMLLVTGWGLAGLGRRIAGAVSPNSPARSGRSRAASGTGRGR